jgi:hypothetical protein
MNAVAAPIPFRCTFAGWLGNQLTGSVWLLLAGVSAVRLDAGTAVVVLTLFSLSNAIGLALWSARERFHVFRSIQALAWAQAGCSMLAVFVLDRSGLWDSVQLWLRAPAEIMYAVIAATTIGAIVALRTYVQKRRR